jgi:hypothetical protein
MFRKGGVSCITAQTQMLNSEIKQMEILETSKFVLETTIIHKTNCLAVTKFT